MKRKQIDGSLSRRILQAAIWNDGYLKLVSEIYRDGSMSDTSADALMRWCIQHYKEYMRAPGKAVEDLFDFDMVSGPQKKELTSLVQSIIEEHDEPHADLNIKYLMKRSAELFRRNRLKKTRDLIDAGLEDGNIDVAENAVDAHRSTEIEVTTPPIDLYVEEEALKEAFEAAQDPLFEFPGPLGDLINDEFMRGNFLAFMGPEKRGKTWWLQEIGFQAYKQRRNVAFFGAGDMSARQMRMRGAIRLCGKSHKERYCGELLIPVLDCKRNRTGDCPRSKNRSSIYVEDEDGEETELTWEEAPEDYSPCARCRRNKNFEGAVWYKKRNPVKPLTRRQAIRASRRFQFAVRGVRHLTECYPNDSLSAVDIETRLDSWEYRYGFVPDVVIVDYADILAPIDRSMQYRHQQNQTWQRLRSIGQKRDCLVVTATQADAGSYGKGRLGLSNFSDDKRKYGHVTGMLALNQTEQEKIAGLMRLGWLVRREDDFAVSREVHVLQCPQIGRPVLGSYV